MRIGRICRLRLSSRFKNPPLWFGVLAFASAFVVVPAPAQVPSGAAAVAAGAAAAATASAPAPKRTAASVALDAATMGNSDLTPTRTNNPAPAEEATNAGVRALPAAAVPGPPLKGVAAQCANLLKMATDLKAEVDRTTQDVLSVAVIRDAGQIEQMAKKMRQAQH